MSRSITPGQKRQLKAYCSQVVEGLNDLEYEAVKLFIDEGAGVRFVKDGLNSLFRTHIRLADSVTPASGSAPRIWTPSRTIKVGRIKDEKSMRAALKAVGRGVDAWASDILPQVRYSEVERDVNLVFVSNEDLGLTADWIPLQQTHDAGLKQGLELCEWEDGPLLAEDYQDQPKGEVLRMAMKKPIVDSNGDQDLFVVNRDFDGLWFRGGCGDPGYQYLRSSRFVFRCK